MNKVKTATIFLITLIIFALLAFKFDVLKLPDNKNLIGRGKLTKSNLSIPTDWRKYESRNLKLSFYYPTNVAVQEYEGYIRLDFGTGTPARAGIFLGKNYRGEPSKEWYLQNHPEISIEDKKNLRFSEYKAFGFEGTLVSYVGSNYGFDTNLLIPRLGKLYIVSTNSLGDEFFSLIHFDD